MTANSQPGYLGLLRKNRPLRHLWLGRLVSNMGDWFNIIALYHAVQLLTDSAQAVVLVVVVKTLPVFLMSPLSGPLVDRFDRRLLMLAMDGFRILAALALIGCFWLESLVALYVCVTLMVCATGVALPALHAALPMVARTEHIPMANALLGATWSVSLAFGAALGGAATELFGVTAALLIDAGTFALSGYFAWRLPHLPAPARQEAEKSAEQSAATDSQPTRDRDQAIARATGFREGLRYLWRTPYILCVTSLKSLMQLYGGLTALVPLYGTVVFADASGPWCVGILYAVRGVGALVGSLALRAIFGDDIRVIRVCIAVSFAVAGVAFASLAFVTEFWHVCVSFFFSALGQSAIYVYSGSLLQLEADKRYHGRVFALDIGVMTLILSTTSYAAGLALDLGVALDTVVLVGASLALFPLVLWSVVIALVARRHDHS